MDLQPKQPQKSSRNLTVTALILLVVVCIGIFISNLQPGRWLISDNLSYPELVPASGQMPLVAVIQREIAAGNVQRIPSEIVSLILHVLLPSSYVRYGYFAVLILAAVIGLYMLAKLWLKHARYANPEIGAAAGGLLYVSSAFVIQSIYSLDIPTVTAFAILPWLLYLSGKYIATSERRWLGFFALASALGIEAGGHGGLYIVIIGMLLLCGISASRAVKSGKTRLGFLILVNLIVNAVWLIPNLLSGSFMNATGDITIKQHLPFLAQLINTGNFSSATLLSQFQTDWVAHWQSPVIFVLLLIPIILGLLLSVWLIILRRGVYRIVAVLTVFSALVLVLINIGIAIDSLSWPEISSIKQMLGLLLGFGIAIVVSRFAQWAVVKLFSKLTGSALLSLAITGVSLLFYVVLVINPVFQNHLYSTISQAQLPESYQQLYSYFAENPSTGNVLYIAENLQQDQQSSDFTLSSLSLNKYAFGQQLISLSDPATANAYWDTVHVISAGNDVKTAEFLKKQNIAWVVLDQANLQSGLTAVKPIISPLVVGGASFQKVDRIDAGRNELAIYQVVGSDPNFDAQIISPAPLATLPVATVNTISAQTLNMVADPQTTDSNIYIPFRNISPDRMEVDHASQTIHMISKLDANSYKNMVFPALAQLNLENVTLKMTKVNGQLQIDLTNVYPRITTDDRSVSNSLTSVTLATLPQPTSKYTLVVGDQVWGPFEPQDDHAVQIDTLKLTAASNIRMYEQYDENDVTSQFQQSLARNCVTYDLIQGATTTVSGGEIKITSPEDICIAADLPVIETDGSVLTITNFDYTANNSFTTCMFNKTLSDCSTRNLADNSIADGAKHHQQIVEELGKVGIRDLQTKFFLRKTTSASNRTATLSNISIAEYKLTQSVTAEIPTWTTAQTVGVTNVGTIQAVIPFAKAEEADFNSAPFVDSFKACDGLTPKIELIPQQNQHALQITSSSKLCVQRDYPNVRSGKGNMFFLDYKLPAQESVNLCVWDVQQNLCLQNTSLTGSDIRQEVLLPIPRHGQQNTSLRLIFSSDSTTETEFIISDIKLIEANTDTLQSIYLSNTLPVAAATVKTNGTKAAFGYRFSAPANLQQPAMLIVAKPFNSTYSLVHEGSTSSNPLAILTRLDDAAQNLTANGWQQAWDLQTVTGTEFYLVNQNIVNTEIILIAQVLLLIVLLGLPLAKDVLVAGIIKRSHE